MSMFLKNTAGQTIGFTAVDATDGGPKTSGVSATITKDGGTQTASAGTLTHKGNGHYDYLFTQAETNADTLTLGWSGSDVVPGSLTIYSTTLRVVDLEPTVQDALDAAIGAESAASAAAVDAATLEARLTAERAGHLDADISSRLAGDDYTAPDNDGIAGAQSAAQAAATDAAIIKDTMFNPSTDEVDIGKVKGVPVTGIEDFRTNLTPVQSNLQTIIEMLSEISGTPPPAPPAPTPPPLLPTAIPNLNTGLYNPPQPALEYADGLSLNLCAVRLQFVRAVGDYNLLQDGDEKKNLDNGADFFLNQAQRWLDLRSEHPALYRRYLQGLQAGDDEVHCRLLIQPSEILVRTSETIYKITPYRVEQERGIRAVREENRGRPRQWSLISHRPAPESGLPEGPYTVKGQIVPGFAFRKILLQPATDSPITVEVLGKFFSERLFRCEDVSVWTVEYPSLLVTTASMFYERLYGTATRLNTLREQALEELDAIDTATVQADLAERELDLEWNGLW